MIDKSPANPLPEIKSPYAYAQMNAHPGCSIKAFDGKTSYTLEMHKLTDKAIEIRLRIPRKDIVEQRKSKGYAVYEDLHITTLGFNELVNRIFCEEHELYHNEEAFPDKVKEVMKRTYD